MTLRTLAPLLLALAASVPARGQVVAGEFVDADGSPIPSARVSLQNERGATVGSVLTDAAGRFQLRAPDAGRYRVRGERIGFELTETDPLELAGDGRVDQRMVANARRVMLATVVVEAGSRCGGSDATPETRVVWDEVRKALGMVSDTSRRATYTLERFERELDPTSRAVRRESRRTEAGTSDKPFIPADLARLANQGYIERQGDTLVYQAPDADVLLSQAFLEDHCFRLRTAGAPAEGLIGLAFEPVRSRRVPDVEGVLWVDRASAELRQMEWSYTRAPIPGPRGSSGIPGGQMEFRRLPDGRWITSAWVLRMPEEGRSTAAAYGTGARRVVVAIKEAGGAVRSVGGVGQ